ncbi:hypothetical protein BDQ12DRAFT_687918 [Crucibulum laeve]|uniref:Uncharacterized protein n=1 Tax=Crucibulum laeve TaxID=68775 RepID=A0A5C3M3W1_9AGAR|nr:hypothetical protein BDQ12DRAFT_687918 [Crucibulum laeve]
MLTASSSLPFITASLTDTIAAIYYALTHLALAEVLHKPFCARQHRSPSHRLHASSSIFATIATIYNTHSLIKTCCIGCSHYRIDQLGDQHMFSAGNAI